MSKGGNMGFLFGATMSVLVLMETWNLLQVDSGEKPYDMGWDTIAAKSGGVVAGIVFTAWMTCAGHRYTSAEEAKYRAPLFNENIEKRGMLDSLTLGASTGIWNSLPSRESLGETWSGITKKIANASYLLSSR